jgi:hypothetical protein
VIGPTDTVKLSHPGGDIEKPAGQRSIRELTPRDRRPLVVATLVRTFITIASLFVVYLLVPLEPITNSDTAIRLVVVLVLLAVGFAGQVHAIRSATYPDLRASEAVITGIVAFVILFALLYLSIGLSSPSSFSQPLNRVSAIYFTVTILSTVGFGDITATSDGARLIVTLQMLLDLALIAIIVRVYFATARASEQR